MNRGMLLNFYGSESSHFSSGILGESRYFLHGEWGQPMVTMSFRSCHHDRGLFGAGWWTSEGGGEVMMIPPGPCPRMLTVSKMGWLLNMTYEIIASCLCHDYKFIL